jgi:hypothetical protein
LYVRTHGIDYARDLMPGDARIREPREGSALDEHVAMANATSLDPNADLVSARLGHIALHKLELAIRTRDLNCANLRHLALTIPGA